MRTASLRRACLLLAGLALACQGSSAPAARPARTPPPAPTVAVQPPAAAILADADLGGLPRTGTTDRLTLEEAAASAPDQVVALEEYRAWGWTAAARRSWGAGGVRVDVLVVLSDRPAGAARAYAYLAQQAALAPLAAGPCPAVGWGLDQCTLGSGGGRSLVVGRLGPEVFAVDVAGADAAALGARQAARLRAT